MTLRAVLLSLILAGPVPAAAQATAAADAARAAAAGLQAAVADLTTAQEAPDRVAALTRTIAAYEAGLAALRDALRGARLRERELSLRLESERDRLSRLLGVLTQIDTDPGPLLLLHPSGPVGTARSGMILAEVTPAMRVEADRLAATLAELRDLRALQEGAAATLQTGLAEAQAARTALSQAIAARTDLPRRLDEDPGALARLVAAADTLDAFAAGLAPDASADADFATARGRLPMPVLGTPIRRAGEPDPAGVVRPGLTLATRPRALVTAPWPATIRYRGPLLDYGNVMILEPGQGYLLVLAGLGTVYGEVGEVVPAGAPVGLMGGGESGADAFLATAADGDILRGSETLYIELRQGTRPEDPAPWFAAMRE